MGIACFIICQHNFLRHRNTTIITVLTAHHPWTGKCTEAAQTQPIYTCAGQQHFVSSSGCLSWLCLPQCMQHLHSAGKPQTRSERSVQFQEQHAGCSKKTNEQYNQGLHSIGANGLLKDRSSTATLPQHAPPLLLCRCCQQCCAHPQAADGLKNKAAAPFCTFPSSPCRPCWGLVGLSPAEAPLHEPGWLTMSVHSQQQ